MNLTFVVISINFNQTQVHQNGIT